MELNPDNSKKNPFTYDGKTITGIEQGNKIRVTIIIKKDTNGKYILSSQKVEGIVDNDTYTIIENILLPDSTGQGTGYEEDFEGGFKGGNTPNNLKKNEIYIVPKLNNRKMKPVCNNKTIRRRKHN